MNTERPHSEGLECSVSVPSTVLAIAKARL